ncbi:MAG: glycosyltransferase family 39 protein [Candidatus Aenigmarchaeota archaeon]|nr:glycosyltransferase family 39 protein [Candidatus Aenigmarchaeota archaeon]
MEKEIVIEVDIKNPYLLSAIIFSFLVFIVNLQTMLSSPIVFGDSGYHARMSQWIAEKIEYPIWNVFEATKLRATGYFRPPFFNFLVASFLFFFGNHEFWIKLIDPLLSFFVGVSIFLVVKKLYGDKIGLFTSVLTITVPSFVTYSVLVYTDVLYVLFFSLFFYTFILFEKKKDKKYLLVSSVFGALAFLTKIVGMTVLSFMVIVLFYKIWKKRNIVGVIKEYWLWVSVFILLISPLLIRNIHYFGNPLCKGLPFFKTGHCSINNADSKYSFSGRTEKVGTEQDVLSMGFMNYVEFAYGYLVFVPLAFFSGLIYLFYSQDTKKLYILFMFLNLVLLMALQPKTFFVGRAENVARYMLGWVSLIALVASFWFYEAYEFLKNQRPKEVVLLILVFIGVMTIKFFIYSPPFQPNILFTSDVSSSIFLFVVLSMILMVMSWISFKSWKFETTVAFLLSFIIVFASFFQFFYRVNGYYTLVNGNVVQVGGMKSVKQFSKTFFEACDWIKENLPKNVTLMSIWAHRVVYNAQRNCAGNLPDIVLSRNVTEIVENAKKHGITHLFIQKFSIDPNNRHYGEKYDADFVRLLEEYPEAFKKIFENGPSFKDKSVMEQCLHSGRCDGNIIYEIVYK